MSAEPVVPIRERTARPARVILTEWLRERTEDVDEFTTQGLVSEAYRKFANDPEFVEAMVADGIALVVPDLSRELMKKGRLFARTSSGGVSVEALELRTKERLAKVFEHVGEGRHVSLLAMTKPLLRFTIDERRARIASELKTVGFLTDLEKRLPNTTVTVGERFSDADINALYRKHFDSE